MIVTKAAFTPRSSIAHPRNAAFGLVVRRATADMSELRIKL